MNIRTSFVFVFAVFAAATGCTGDKVEAGRRIIDTETDRAIELFQAAEKERGECFDCLIYLGLAYEKKGSIDDAVAAYERATAMKESAGRPEPVSERLLALYEKQHSAAASESRIEIAKKAAELERTLKVARPWASLFLFEKCSADMKTAAGNGDEAAVRAAADACMALTIPADRKNSFATDATRALQDAFVRRTGQKFRETLAGIMTEKGVYNEKSGQITFKNEFTIPSGDSNPEFKADSPEFMANLRKAACVPLHKTFSETVAAAEPVLGLKNVDKSGIDLAFQDIYRKAKAGIGVADAEKRSPAGLPFVCVIDLSLDEFLAALFRFAE